MAIDFSKILSKKAAEIEKPKPLPVGTYLGIATALPTFEGIGKKETPAAVYSFNIVQPIEVDSEDLTAYGEVKGKSVRYNMFLSEASEFRTKEEIVAAFGVEEGDKTLGQMFNETVNVPVILHIIQQPSEDGTEIYARCEEISCA